VVVVDGAAGVDSEAEQGGACLAGPSSVC